MVKGISRQVVVVRSPEPKLFEQAIFILRDDADEDGITEEALLKEARIAASYPREDIEQKKQCLLCGGIGAAVVSILWAITLL